MRIRIERNINNGHQTAERIVSRIENLHGSFGEPMVGYAASLENGSVVSAVWTHPWVLTYCYCSPRGKLIAVRINTGTGKLRTERGE